jgi:uncharacterized membrane-anchored protein
VEAAQVTYRKKVDANQGPIVDALRKAGCSVQSLAAVGKGVPDLLVGLRSKNVLIEVKNPETRGKLNDLQNDWHTRWRGQVLIVTSAEDALAQLDLTGKEGLIG